MASWNGVGLAIRDAPATNASEGGGRRGGGLEVAGAAEAGEQAAGAGRTKVLLSRATGEQARRGDLSGRTRKVSGSRRVGLELGEVHGGP